MAGCLKAGQAEGRWPLRSVWHEQFARPGLEQRLLRGWRAGADFVSLLP